VTAKNILTAVSIKMSHIAEIHKSPENVITLTVGQRAFKAGLWLYVSRRLAMHKITRDRDKSDMPLRIKAQKAIEMMKG